MACGCSASGVSGLSVYAQGDLFAEEAEPVTAEPADERVRAEPEADSGPDPASAGGRGRTSGTTSSGPGWVWGRGLGRVTVRFEGPLTAPGPVRTLAADDPALHPADPPDWRADG